VTDNVLDVIEERAHKRRERWHTTEVPVLPLPNELAEPTIVSKYALCGIESHRRLIKSDILVAVNGVYDTPSSVARDYLITKYKYGPKWTSAQRDRVTQEIACHPLYVRPTRFEEGAYVDVRAAYWSVMVRCGWDVNYYPGKWLSTEDPPLDFPFAYDKRSRNSLVSVARATQVTMWRPSNGYQMETRPNSRPNSQLFCLIMDCLNGMAYEAVQEGAVYAFVDGYIAPDMDTARRIIRRIEEWGFHARIKGIGRGVVTNLGSYRVGTYRTGGKLLDAAEHDGIKRLEYHTWLKDRMQWACDRAAWHEGFMGKEDFRDRYCVGEA